ncbi:MAG: hypothetical protein V1725_06305 [archaeon]
MTDLQKLMDSRLLFLTQAEPIIDASLFRERVRSLLSSPERGRYVRHAQDTDPSNCFGTTLYIVGSLPTPRFVHGDKLSRCLEQNSLSKKKPDSIIALFDEEHLLHTGVYLGDCAQGGVVIHQPDTGEDYAVDPLEAMCFLYPATRKEFYTFRTS